MKQKTVIILIVTFITLLFVTNIQSQNMNTTEEVDASTIPSSEKLVIVWTSADRDVALKMVFMYLYNAKKNNWWKDITLVVWGPSAKLISEDKELQEYLGKIIDLGVIVKACKGCSDQYGVSEKLEELKITVKYIGVELTDYIKEGRHILTF
jgi:hypothetical protein